MFGKIPSVHLLLEQMQIEFPDIQPKYLKHFIQEQIGKIRLNPKQFKLEKTDKETFEQYFKDLLISNFHTILAGSLKPVINATGIVLHTNLGRAPLNPELTQKLIGVSRYTNLELNLETGRRGQRNVHLATLLKLLSGAEDGFAVNNNAAAVMLMLNSTAYKKEVILSRGEMVEIGGSFRLPEVMKMSGCKLKEIGTTNKTHLKDYQDAISEKTGAILLCHTSNYIVNGFTAKPELEEVVQLAKEYDIPLIYDLGSGAFEKPNFKADEAEPLVADIVKSGVDLVSFSGDKLLGGPQAGLLVGKQKWVKRCASNHLLRALRLDKFMIALLEQSLLAHLSGSINLDSVQALGHSLKFLKDKCLQFIDTFPSPIKKQMEVVTSKGQVGSGAYPILYLDSFAVAIQSKIKASRLAAKLRQNDPPVIGYIENDTFHLDLRTVNEKEQNQLASALNHILS